MATTRERLEQIIRRLILEFATEDSKKPGRNWRDTPFDKFVPGARRRSIMFRRVLAEIPSIRSTVAELVDDRSLTPGRLLDRMTDSVGAGGRGPIKASPKKAAVKKALPWSSWSVAGGVPDWSPGPIVSPLSPPPAKKTAHSSTRIFYATDRKPLATLSAVRFGSERQTNGELSYGTCVVSIPKKHKTGQLESPTYLRLEFRPNPRKHIALLETTTLEEARFLEAVTQSVEKSIAKDAFIFVHGYNVTFEDAARRTGQLAFDLKFIGAPILYSWPANGGVLDYFADEATVIWTAPHFERFLALIATRSGATRIHVIAHSMGNRTVCDALKSLSSTRSQNQEVLLSHLVLAAPDIDAGTFQELALALKQVSKFVTLYASSRDRAIKLSQKLHKAPRAGAPPLVVVPGIDSIDASALGADWLAHSYFTHDWPALSDIYTLLSADTPAAKRFGLNEQSNEQGNYFVLRV
jgi:esterase/lipase superfamily enzyme